MLSLILWFSVDVPLIQVWLPPCRGNASAQSRRVMLLQPRTLRRGVLWGHLSRQALPDVAEAGAPEPISGATRTCLLKMGPQAHCPHFSHLFVTGLTCPSQESHPRFTTSYDKPSPSALKSGAHPLSLPHPTAASSASAGATFGARNADTRQDYVRHHQLGPHPSTIYEQ